MSAKEIRYTEVISKVIAGKIKQAQASEILELSLRQVKRLCKRYKAEGVLGLSHKSRGKSGNRCINSSLRNEIVKLIHSNYSDFGPKLIHEQLKERHGILISSEWIRQQMVKEHLWIARKNKKIKVYQRRSRRDRKGELIQIDGSYHDWFEGRGPKCCLLVAIDDATSELLELRFEHHETTEGYMNLMKKYINKRGSPISIYSDRLNIFSNNSQFKRALKELNISLINANSPQAKGRVERANLTLQDRLIKLMRLENISTMEEANEYVEKYKLKHNQSYARKAKNSEDAHRQLEERINLERVLCIKETRTVSKDLSISYKNKKYIIKSIETGRLRDKTAKIFEIDKVIHIEIDGTEYGYEIYEEQPFQEPMNRKEIDAWIDKKPKFTVIERMRKQRKGY